MERLDKYAIIRAFAKEYKHSSKGQRGRILKEVIALTGYYKSYASELLTKPPLKRRKIYKRLRFSKYLGVLPELKRLWAVSNFSCGKILHEAIPPLIESLERFDEIKLSKKKRKLLLNISAATCDRLLKAERKKLQIKGRSGTKPGTLLKSQIPVRIFTPWDEEHPGFLEIDLVAHCGDSLWGEFVNTLDGVDIATTWTEKEALMGKSERFTLAAFNSLEKRFPFKILGIDSDNGSEFINDHFLRMCQKRNITFTRSRPSRSNDQAHVEQKNFSTVRKLIGYQRLDTQIQLQILNQIYRLYSSYLNFFIPSYKLLRKEHVGSKVKRIYDKARSPYQRVLEHPEIGRDIKQLLKKKYLTLNPSQLLKDIQKLSKQLGNRA